MRSPIKTLTTLLLLLVLMIAANGFNIAPARKFKAALPGYTFSFPRDHAAHEAYKTEWWYYTGHLETESGREFGYELTFFRVGNDTSQLPDTPNWRVKNVYMTHFAVTDIGPKKFVHTQKLNRAALNRAGAETTRYRVWNENWSAQLINGVHHLKANSDDYAINLQLTPTKKPVIHGKNGVSQKAACKGCASHYYSLTRMQTRGQITVNGKTETVTGLTWMDQEFGSNQLADNQQGWDWFSIQLDDGTELMLYQLRQKAGTIEPLSSGTFIRQNGSATHLTLDEFSIQPTGQWTSDESKGTYPMGWKIDIPREALSVTVTPVFEAQELYNPYNTGITYWEGSSRVSGTRKGQPVRGKAYVEMTGYAEAFEQNI